MNTATSQWLLFDIERLKRIFPLVNTEVTMIANRIAKKLNLLIRILLSFRPTSKLELIESLSKSIRAENSKKEEDFYNSFGAFASEKSAEEIINEIKESRNFRNKDLELT